VNELELLDALKSVDRNRLPRPEFDAALRGELFEQKSRTARRDTDDAEIVDLATFEPIKLRPKTRVTRRVVLIGVAAALVVIIGASVALRKGGGHPQVSTVSKPSVANACQTFAATAFSGLTRAQLLGGFNNSALSDSGTARKRVETLSTALSAFRTNLESAGVHDNATLATLDAAQGFATRALSMINAGSLGAAADSVKEIGTQLEATQRDLTRLGIASCL
jgi:hypothetical protein